jgi:hypothetical protein
MNFGGFISLDGQSNDRPNYPDQLLVVLSDYGIDISQMNDLDPLEDEGIVELHPGKYLYFVYAKNDDGSYDFHSEVTDEDGLEDILSDEEEDND